MFGPTMISTLLGSWAYKVTKGVWKMCERCMESVWKVSEMCLKGVWKVSGRYLEGVWNVFCSCMEGAKVYESCLVGDLR